MTKFYELAVRIAVFALITLQSDGGAISKVENKTKIHRGIHKRGLFYPVLLYPYNACSGILVAIAIPLPNTPVKDQSAAFMSYNFEANYNMPNQPEESVPGMIIRFPGLTPDKGITVDAAADATPDNVIMGRNLEKTISSNSTGTTTEKTKIVKREVDDSIVLSRKGVYRLIESRLTAQGIDGKKCLLLAICESSKHQLLEVNGVLGHILHIVLT